MKRDILEKLEHWSRQKDRNPLIINGARQVGKTYAIKRFAEQYNDSLYINFEEAPELIPYFDANLSPKHILSQLAVHFGRPINEDCLLMYDEIQACPRAVTSLKYMQEEMPGLPVIAAGSLLGVKLKRENVSFPVGKVNFLDMYPLTFFEYLDAIGKNEWRRHLEGNKGKEIAAPLHESLLAELKNYLCIGGMPGVVKGYIDSGNILSCREKQLEILRTYTLDFSKYAETNEVMKLSEIWNSIPKHLSKENKKFIFSLVNESARAREYMSSLQWLEDAGLIYRSYNISTPQRPLSA